MNSEYILGAVAPLLGLAVAAVIVLARIASCLKEDLEYTKQRAEGYERMYDERVDRINALEANAREYRKVAKENDDRKGVLAATLNELAEAKAKAEWAGTMLDQAHASRQKLYDLIVTTVNSDAKAARKASEDAVERFLKIADAADRRANDVIREAMTIIGGTSDGEDECECCREKRRQDRQGLGGRPTSQPGDAGGLLRDGGQGTGWRPGVRQPGGQAHQVHQYGSGRSPTANPVDGADDDAH